MSRTSVKSSVASNPESFRGWTLDMLNIVLGSATVPVAVCNVPLRTASASSVRRDADRRERDALPILPASWKNSIPTTP